MAGTIRFSIPVGSAGCAEKLAFALEHGLGAEIVAFATGAALADSAARIKIESEFAGVLRDFPNPHSFHGAFIDLQVHSGDPAIAAVALDRIRRDMETAARLNCHSVVFHTGFNPLVPVQTYSDEFVERHAAVWPEIANAWPGLRICLENVWEPAPALFDRLLQAINHPSVNMCLDVAHAHVYADFAVETWIERLNTRIAHMHWNDNHGDSDTHLAIGEGNVPWKTILTSSRLHCREATVVLELKTLRAIKQSLQFLYSIEANHADRAVIWTSDDFLLDSV